MNQIHVLDWVCFNSRLKWEKSWVESTLNIPDTIRGQYRDVGIQLYQIMSPFQNGTEKGTCCVGRTPEFKSFNGLLRDHSSSPLRPPFINEKYRHSGKSQDGSRPSIFWRQHSILVIAPSHYRFPRSLIPALFIMFPIFQHEYIKPCKFTILWSSYLHDRQCTGLMDQFLKYGHHRNINTFSFSLWPTWLARFTNYVKRNNDSKEKCLISLVVSFILSCKVTCEFNLMLV